MTAAERAARLEEFARRCSARASEFAGRELEWRVDGDFARFHCPLGRDHAYKGGPRAWATLGAGVKAGCEKCTGSNAHDEQYARDVCEVIGWEQVEAEHAADEEIRHHDFETVDGRYVVRHRKLRQRGPGGSTWRWAWRSTEARGAFVSWQRGPLEDLIKVEYPAYEHAYQAVHLYQHERLRHDGRPKDVYRLAILEGERDCDTFNALMIEASSGIVATTLSHPNPRALAPHHDELIDGRDVIVVRDHDEGGRRFADAWTSVVFHRAASVKAPAVEEMFQPGEDFTDWTARRLKEGATRADLAREVIDWFTRTPKLDAPLAEPMAWKHQMRKSAKTGTISATHPSNAKLVWTMHPDLEGRVRFNRVTGDVMIVDPPWGGEDVVGARHAAVRTSLWLDEDHRVYITPRTLQDVVDFVAEPHDPYAEMLAEEWDGTPRLDALFIKHVPLDVARDQAVALARVFMGDLVAKMRGQCVTQRLVLAIATDKWFDLAGALLGEHACFHPGRIRDAAQFTRSGNILVQLDMGAVAHRTVAPGNWQHMFTRSVMIGDHVTAAPAFIAIGPRPTAKQALQEMNERTPLVEMSGEVDLATLDAPQVLAEAVARLDELCATAAPDKGSIKRLDEEARRQALLPMVQALVAYCTRTLDLNYPVDAAQLERLPRCTTPRRHVVRDRFFRVMRPLLIDEWARPSDWVAAFGAMQSLFHLPRRVGLTPKTAKWVQEDLDFSGRTNVTLMGTFINPDKLNILEMWLEDQGVEIYPDFTNQEPQKPSSFSVLPLTSDVGGEKEFERNKFIPFVARAPDSNMLGESGSGNIGERVEFNIGAPISARRSDGEWVIEVGGVAVDPAALAEAIDDELLLCDVELRSPRPDRVREWLAEVGLAATVADDGEGC